MLSISSIFCAFHRNHPRRQALAAAGVLLLSSSLMAPAHAMAYQSSSRISFTGNVSSGQHPITESLIVLLSAGSKGYGSKPSIVDLTLSDTHGNFNFPVRFECPASPNDQMYVVAVGGNAGSGYNDNLTLMTGLGTCANLTASTAVEINEVSTVAAAYSLSPFMTTAGEVGASSTNYKGLVNAMQTINNLVSLTGGQALSITPAYAANSVAFLNTSTVPQSRINTLADMLSACVESDGTRGSSTACSTLFAAATPTGGTAPANTLQAALNIAQNPGTNVASLFALASSTSPYRPILSAAPTDWTLALTYTGAGLGVPPGLSSGSVQNSTLTIDANGNLYVNAGGIETGEPTGNNFLAQFNNLGAPLTPATTVNESVSPAVITYGGFQANGNLPGVNTNSAAFDSNGNLWIAGEDLFEVATSPSLALSQEVAPADGANSVAIDSSANIWLSNEKSFIQEFNATGTFLNQYATPAPSFRTTVNDLTFDSAGNFWAQQSNAANTLLYSAATGTVTASFSGEGPFAANASGNVYGCNTSETAFNVYNASTTTGPMATYTATGRCAIAMALDGLGNVWAVNGTDTGDFLDELSSTGTALSPASGYTGTSSSEGHTLFAVANANSLAIDGSGNLWVLNEATGSNSNTITGNVLVEYVGVAAPVATPLATALQNNKLATRP